LLFCPAWADVLDPALLGKHADFAMFFGVPEVFAAAGTAVA
jgi:hypothetical protein